MNIRTKQMNKRLYLLIKCLNLSFVKKKKDKLGEFAFLGEK